jgi:hypothetical protein
MHAIDNHSSCYLHQLLPAHHALKQQHAHHTGTANSQTCQGKPLLVSCTDLVTCITLILKLGTPAVAQLVTCTRTITAAKLHMPVGGCIALPQHRMKVSWASHQQVVGQLHKCNSRRRTQLCIRVYICRLWAQPSCMAAYSPIPDQHTTCIHPACCRSSWWTPPTQRYTSSKSLVLPRHTLPCPSSHPRLVSAIWMGYIESQCEKNLPEAVAGCSVTATTWSPTNKQYTQHSCLLAASMHTLPVLPLAAPDCGGSAAQATAPPFVSELVQPQHYNIHLDHVLQIL